MDSAVLIRFIQFLELIFSRINSKRLMVFYGLLLFLLASKNVTPEAVYAATGLAVLVLLLYMVKTPTDVMGSQADPAPDKDKAVGQ